MEEFYNQLLNQFHHNTASNNFITEYKNISSELVSLGRSKKQQLLAYKEQLSTLNANKSQKENTIHNNKFYSQAILDQSTPTALQQETQFINDADLKKNIINLEKEITKLKQKTNQLMHSLNLIQNKKEQLAQINGEIELGTFHRNQRFIIQSNYNTKKERCHQQTLQKLQNRHHSIQEQIKKIVKLKEYQQKLKQKWKISQHITTIRTQQQGLKMKQLYTILRTLYYLVKLNQSHRRGDHFDKQAFFNDLLPAKEALTMNRAQILNYFQERGINANQQQIHSIIHMYHGQQYQFDYNQRANQQISHCLQTQHTNLQNVNNTLLSLQEQKQERTMHNLKQRQLSIKRLQSKITSNCILIISASTQLSQLIHKLQNYRRTLRQTVQSITNQSKTQQGSGYPTTKSYIKLLNRNCEQIVLEWTKVLGIQNSFYYEIIQKNDILRIYASPDSYKLSKDSLQNYQNIFIVSFQRARICLMHMFAQLMSNLNEKCTFKGLKQQSNTPYNDFCAQSKYYFRRDDFRLIEEQQKQNISPIQFSLDSNFDSQLLPFQHKNSSIHPFSSYSRPSIAHHHQIKYTNRSIRLEQNIQNTSTLRKMLSRLNSLNTSHSNTLRVPKSPFNSISSPNVCRTIRISPNTGARNSNKQSKQF